MYTTLEIIAIILGLLLGIIPGIGRAAGTDHRRGGAVPPSSAAGSSSLGGPVLLRREVASWARGTRAVPRPERERDGTLRIIEPDPDECVFCDLRLRYA